MKLTTVHITNFRSAEDAGKFEVGDSLCLVGKNEAGKSALLQALAAINPHPSTPFAYNVERDYPRRHLTEYSSRHGRKQAVVARTEWLLSKEERQALIDELGEGAIDIQPIIISRAYGDDDARFDPIINYKRAIQNFLTKEGLSAAECELLSSAENSDVLRKILSEIASRTENQSKALAKLEGLPGKNFGGLATVILRPFLPRFMYFSHYDRMDGQIRLDTFNARKAANPSQITTGEQVFVDFLEYAGTSIDEIVSAKTYESLNARCEAASNRITEQLQEYWTQNPHLEIEVRVTKAEPNDPPPFNEGVIARARVRNNLHRLTLPFSERSAGFIWFFSFLVKFAQVQKASKSGLILLLDEPGLTLHGKAQADLLRYFAEKLAPKHQLIYSTHSPFMVPADNLAQVRIVEDRVTSPKPGRWESEGTKVRDDVLAVDRDTLFPLQGALGYEITQTLFVGKHTLLVEGPGDILFLQAWSSALQRKGKTKLDPRWTICPAGGIDKIQPFVSLFSAAKLDLAALSDYAKADKKKLEALRQNKVLETDRLLTFASLLGADEADIEDVFIPSLYVRIVNEAFGLQGKDKLTVTKVEAADKETIRLVKKVEASFRTLSPDAPEFDHFTPAGWLFRNPGWLDSTDADVVQTLERAEKIVEALNALLPRQ